MPTPDKPTVLTGDRTTGPLHLGHLAGSLRSRLDLQGSHRQFVLLADAQALTDHADDPAKVRDSVIEVVADYLAVGIDPGLTTICLQSALPALAELAMFYLNLVTVARLERNPTVKDEIRSRGFERDMPAGFLCYPVAQAADITGFRAELVPVGEDQLPMIEQCNEIVRRLNRQIGRDLLPEALPLLSGTGRLPGLDGRGKMSKSRGEAITLSASDERLGAAVDRMYTDPDHLRATDPGRVEGNVVFAYLDAFDPDREAVSDLKARYRRGGLGDVALKHRLKAVLRDVIGPIRERRAAVMRDRDALLDVVRQGTTEAEAITGATKAELFDAFGVFRAPRPARTRAAPPEGTAGPRVDPERAMGSLHEIRDGIDRLDRDIVQLMAERGRLVEGAARFKASRAEVEAPRRVEEVIAKVKASAERAGLAPQVVQATYRAMVSAFIAVEHAAFAALEAGAPDAPETARRDHA